MRCDKCLTEIDDGVKYAVCGQRGGSEDVSVKKYLICYLCNKVYDVPLLEDFLKDDYGCFPISTISKNMIEARKKRALGISPWNQSNGDNKAQAAQACSVND